AAADARAPRAQHVALGAGSWRAADEAQADPGPAVPHLVDEEAEGAVRVDHDDVGVAVVVDVAEGGAAAHPGAPERLAHLARHLGEAAAVQVAEHLRSLSEG